MQTAFLYLGVDIMSVFFDGEKLCVQLARGKDYKKVLKLAEQYDSEYIASVGIYVFPPIKKIAWALEEAGYPFDKSAEMFLQKKKEIEIPEIDEQKRIVAKIEELLFFASEKNAVSESCLCESFFSKS